MKVRIISAIVALLIVVPLILLGGIFYKIGILVVATLAFKELMSLKKSHGEYPLFMQALGVVLMWFLILQNTGSISIYDGFSYQILALVAIIIIMPIIFYKKDIYISRDAFYLFGIVLFLGLVFNIFIVLRNRGLGLFFFLILIPIFNDIFAYFIGCKFGKNKMCPLISPKKTWEGSLGGLVIGSIVGLFAYKFLVGSITIKIIVIILILSVVGQLGDLVMSKVKRENEIKDFSNIMPGHGGILDRLDSMIFVFLTYMVLITI